MYYDELIENADDLFITNKQDMGKHVDKNYEQVTILLNSKWKDGKFYKKVIIDKFGSGLNGCRIRNAVTGGKYPHMVGSSNEDLYFKVCDTSAHVRKDPLILYYDTPEQYENHFFTNISQRIKTDWYEKKLYTRTKQLNN